MTSLKVVGSEVVPKEVPGLFSVAPAPPPPQANNVCNHHCECHPPAEGSAAEAAEEELRRTGIDYEEYYHKACSEILGWLEAGLSVTFCHYGMDTSNNFIDQKLIVNYCIDNPAKAAEMRHIAMETAVKSWRWLCECGQWKNKNVRCQIGIKEVERPRASKSAMAGLNLPRSQVTLYGIAPNLMAQRNQAKEVSNAPKSNIAIPPEAFERPICRDFVEEEIDDTCDCCNGTGHNHNHAVIGGGMGGGGQESGFSLRRLLGFSITGDQTSESAAQEAAAHFEQQELENNGFLQNQNSHQQAHQHVHQHTAPKYQRPNYIDTSYNERGNSRSSRNAPQGLAIAPPESGGGAGGMINQLTGWLSNLRY